MSSKKMMRSAAALFAWAVSGVVVAASPAVFSDLKVDDAIDRGREQGRMVVLDFTAVWCGPCRKMDRTTWVDEDVVAWMKANAIGVQVDVDEQDEVARAYHVRAMPTMIAIVDGEVADRGVGYKTPEQLLAWLDAARTGDGNETDRLRRATLNEDGTKNTDVDARYALAKRLLEEGAYAEATGEFVWLWHNMVKYSPFMVGVRNSFLVSNIERLVGEHEEARSVFASIRDEAGSRLEGKGKKIDDLVDWFALNEALGDGDRSLEWYEQNKDNPKNARAIQRVRPWIGRLLVEHERWAELGAFYTNPVHEVRRSIAMLDEDLPDADEQTRAQLREMRSGMITEQASRMYGACLAAGREASATKIAALLLETVDTPEARVALVTWALDVGAPRPEQRRWIEEASGAGASCEELATRLEAALAGGGGA